MTSITLNTIAISKSSYLHVVVICQFALRAIPSSPALLHRTDNIPQPPCPSDFLIHLANENQWLKIKEQEKWRREGIPLPFPLFGMSSLVVTVHLLWFPLDRPSLHGQNSCRASLPASAVWSLILDLSDIPFTSSKGEVRWHHQLNGHEFEQAPGVGDGQGSLACCSPWSCKESGMTHLSKQFLKLSFPVYNSECGFCFLTGPCLI